MSGFRSFAICLTGAGLLAACASRPTSAPSAAPLVRQAPSPPAAPPPPVEIGSDDWRDRPVTPGDWSYDAGAVEARYADFSLRCDGARRQVVLSRSGASGPLRLYTTYGEHLLAPGAALPAADPRLDEIAYSRGRFMVEAKGMATLVLPAWPEPARVVEDCRG